MVPGENEFDTPGIDCSSAVSDAVIKSANNSSGSFQAACEGTPGKSISL